MILTLKAITGFLKGCTIYLLGMAIAIPIEQSLGDTDFILELFKSVPSQIIMTFSVIYLAFILFTKGSNSYYKHLDNIEKHRHSKKLNKENAEQEHIETEVKRKELNE